MAKRYKIILKTMKPIDLQYSYKKVIGFTSQQKKLPTNIETINENKLIIKHVEKMKKLKCDVCGSSDIIEAPHMGINCNKCNPL